MRSLKTQLIKRTGMFDSLPKKPKGVRTRAIMYIWIPINARVTRVANRVQYSIHNIQIRSMEQL